jgi:hypothetical protein
VTRVEIDLNVRVRGNLTYAGFEDADGPVAVGQPVEVFESESGLAGRGTVSEIDWDARLIYLRVAWAQLQPPALTPTDVVILSAGLARQRWSASAEPTDGLAVYGVGAAAATLTAGTSSSTPGRPMDGALEPSVVYAS